MLRSVEGMEAVVGGVVIDDDDDDDDAKEVVGMVGATGAIPCNSGRNESRAEDTMGGKTGGRSKVNLGTPGGGVDGMGLGEGIARSCSPDGLRMGERMGEGDTTC